MEYKYKIGFLGSGNMAKAIALGIIDSKILDYNEIIMSATTKKEPFLGISITNDNNTVIENSEYLVLAVKPQIFNQIKDTLKNSKAKYIISIMAGVKVDKLKEIFPHSKVIRTMPNTPCSIKNGMVAVSNNNAGKEANEFITKVFSSIAEVEYLDEDKFDAVTSISGSGPAYVYYFIQSMIKAGINGGLDYKTAKKLTLQTVFGATKMVENSIEDLDILIEKVCSKGGTTIQAIDTFKDNKIQESIIEGIDKCRKRSEELSK